MNWAMILPVFMLAGSNIIMNFAFYGHLKAPDRAIWVAVLISWGLALAEYCLVVPATRLGATVYTLPQLKTLQVSLSVATFVFFAWFLFDQKPTLMQLGGFVLIVCGAAAIFSGK